MPLYLLDTNTVSAVMADHPKVKAHLTPQPGTIVTSAIVRGEIRYGLERLPVGARRANLEAKATIVLATLPVEPITATAADVYAALRRGPLRPLQLVPCWSATIKRSDTFQGSR